MRLLILIIALVAVLHISSYAEELPPDHQPTTANEYLTQAKELLGKGKRVLAGAEMEKMDAAIAAIDTLMIKQPETTGDKLDPKVLRSIIAAKFLVKGDANDDLAISYTAWDSALTDWTVTGSAPTIIKGALSIEPGGSVTTKVQFKTATVSGEVMSANKEGQHLSASGFSVLTDNYNAWRVKLLVSGTIVGTAAYDKAYTQTDGGGVWIPFLVKVDQHNISLTWKGQKLAGPINSDFGALTLSGGTGGNQFRGLTLSGIVDHKWVAAAVQQKAIDDAMAATKKKK